VGETEFNFDSGEEQFLNPKKANISHSDDSWMPNKAKSHYHEQRLAQSKWSFRLSFWGSIVGFAVIIISAVFMEAKTIGVLSGAIIEAVSALFYKLSDKSNEKISEFFETLMHDTNIDRSVKLASEIKNKEIKDELLVKLSLHLAGIDEEHICKKSREICTEIDKKEEKNTL
jgi:hypothetical protein